MDTVVVYPSVAALFFRIIFTLIFIVFVAYLILRLIQRQQNLQQNQKKWVKIFDYQALGSNRGLYLMELYGHTCIVAVSEGQINILQEIDTNTENWEKVKNSLLESEDLLTKGMGKLFKKEKDFPKSDFQQQLAEQFRRNRHLSRGIFQGRDKDE